MSSPGDSIVTGAPEASSGFEGPTPSMEPSEHASSLAGPDELMSDVHSQSSSTTTLVDGTAAHLPAEDTSTEHPAEGFRAGSGQHDPAPVLEECPSADTLPNGNSIVFAGIGEHVRFSDSTHDSLQLPWSPMPEHHDVVAPADDYVHSVPSPAPSTMSEIVHPRTPEWHQPEGIETPALAPMAEDSNPQMDIEVGQSSGCPSRRGIRKYRCEITRTHVQQPRRQATIEAVFDPNPYSTSSVTTSHPWSRCGSADGAEGLDGAGPSN